MIVLSAPTFTAAVVLENGIVVRAAPIVAYMMGWDRRRVLGYAHKRNWRSSEMP
jgi:hypothetical protein